MYYAHKEHIAMPFIISLGATKLLSVIENICGINCLINFVLSKEVSSCPPPKYCASEPFPYLDPLLSTISVTHLC